MALEKNQRLLGGGKLFFEKKVNGVLQEKKEIGEVKNFKITSAVETIEAESESEATPETVDEVIVKQTYSVSFETQQVDKETLTLALFGERGTKTIASGDTLPNGETATEDTTYTVIDPGDELVEGRLTFETTPKRGKKRIVVFYNISLKFNSDLILQAKEFISLPFEAKVKKDPNVSEGSKFFRIYEKEQ